MLRQYELVERVRAYDPQADEDLLNRAYVFSMKAHGSQLRANGDPYFSHPIEVAGILTDLQLDDETIATGILHDTIEDTVATQAEIDKLFGKSVGRLVDGVTKLSKIEAQSDDERAAENLRKFLLAMSDDIRVLLVKLADRLHNMRTLKFIQNPDKRRRIARETMDIYAPLAGRIGMYEVMDELNELGFTEIEPETHASIAARLDHLRAGRGDLVERIAEDVRQQLSKHGIEATVQGREKRPFSIWRKMTGRGVAFDALSDVIAFRVVTVSPVDCYRALGVIHQKWKMVPGRFKDFISTPKGNGYRSLHTTVFYSEGTRVEIQIRDAAMHAEAELGVAAHWAYKQGDEGAAARESYPWLADLVDMLEHAQSPQEVLEHTRMAMFEDQVFVFTPKGALQPLPKGATPVDFAYQLHSDIGDTCVGARVNGRDVPLRTRLVNGDQVEILRSKVKAPDPAWESFVVTPKARAAVRRQVRARERDAQQTMGRQLFEAAVERYKLPHSNVAVAAALVRLKLGDRPGLYTALARQTLTEAALRDALAPGSSAGSGRARKPKAGPAIPIKGLTPGAAFHLADCCHPVPGDRIAGVSRPGAGVEVHALECPVLEREAGERLDLAWDPASPGATARVATVVHNQPGALAAVANIIAGHAGNIVNLSLKHRDREFHTDIIDIEVVDLAQLNAITAALRDAPAVVSVERVTAA